MKRLYSVITFMVMAALGIGAYAESMCLTLHFTNNDVVRFALEEKPAITFEGNDFIVATSTGLKGTYDRADLDNFNFEMGETSSAVNIADDAAYTVEFVAPGIVKIYGNGVDSASVFNVNGQKIAEASNADNAVTIDLQSYPTGVYVIEIPGHRALKLRK